MLPFPGFPGKQDNTSSRSCDRNLGRLTRSDQRNRRGKAKSGEGTQRERLIEWCGWTTGVAERLGDKGSNTWWPHNAAYLAFTYASYLKLLRIRGIANPFNPLKLFTYPQNQDPFWPLYRDSLLAPIQLIGFGFWIWVWVWAKLESPCRFAMRNKKKRKS